MKVITALFTLLLAILLLAPMSHAEDVVVAVDHFPPWKMVEKGKIGGIDIELTKALLAEINTAPTFIPYPWARGLDLMRTGQVDLLSGVLRSPEREKFLTFIEPPYKTRSAKIFYRLKQSKDIETLKDLKGLTIGVQRNAHYFPEFDNNNMLIKEEVNNDRFNFLKLAQGRIHTVITTESQGDYLIAILGLQDMITKSTYRFDYEVPVYFAVSKKSSLNAKKKELDKAALRLRKNGTFANIIREYFKSLESQTK